ncbi:MAG: CsbD family protein [Acidobacteriota bacterium]
MGGITDKLKGKAKRAEGRMTGDKLRETQGAVEEKKGDIENAAARMKYRAKARVNEARAKRSAKKATR